MKTPYFTRLSLKASLLPLALAILVAIPPTGFAQTRPAGDSANEYEQLSPEAVDELVAPFALYPDALIALILPASTVPSDLTLASRYLADGGTDFENQSWDDSVISLARYPDVVTWMDENLAWTAAVGSAFVAQPVDVMNSIQRLRAAAAAAGNLDDTPEQRVVREVVEETTYIRIVPAQPNVIFVPIYNPGVVYYTRRPDYVGNIISFGAGFALGSWLNYDCDWGRRGIYRGDYNAGWYQNNGRGGGNRNVVQNNTTVNVTNITNTSANLWQPGKKSRRQLSQRKDNYNQRVRAANQEVRAAGRASDGKPVRLGRQIKALPQPSPLVVEEKRSKTRDEIPAGKTKGETTRKRDDKLARSAAPKGAAPETLNPVIKPSGTPNRQRKSQSQLPAATPAGKARPGSTSPSPKAKPNKVQRDTNRPPTPAPNEKRTMKKYDRPAAPDSNAGNMPSPEATQPSKKEKRSSRNSSALQPPAAPVLPETTQPLKNPNKGKMQTTNPTTSAKKIAPPNPPASAPPKSQRKPSVQVATPRPSQPQRKVESPKPKKFDRPAAPSQPQRSTNPGQKPKNQNNRPTPTTPSQPQKVRENKPAAKQQPQAAKPTKPNRPDKPQNVQTRPAQNSNPTPTSTDAGTSEKKNKKNKS